MNKNSFTARKQLIQSGKKKTREQLIFELLFFGRRKMTAREILRALFPTSDDMNKTRPRLSDMEDDGAVRVCGEKIEGGLPVNVYEANFPIVEKQQLELFA